MYSSSRKLDASDKKICPRIFLHKFRVGFFDMQHRVVVRWCPLQMANDLWQCLGRLKCVGGQLAAQGCEAMGLAGIADIAEDNDGAESAPDEDMSRMREISGEDDNLVEHVDRIREARDNDLNEQDAESQDELEDPGDPELEDTGDVDPENAKEPDVRDVPIDDLMDPGDPDLDDQ